MKVHELIEILTGMDPEATVLLDSNQSHGDWEMAVDSVETRQVAQGLKFNSECPEGLALDDVIIYQGRPMGRN